MNVWAITSLRSWVRGVIACMVLPSGMAHALTTFTCRKRSLRCSLPLSLLGLVIAASSSLSLGASIIDLDLTTDNSGPITLSVGDNAFSFSGFSVEYLIVAGGGGGGGGTTTATTTSGGGGGAGGLLTGNTTISGLQSIVVGAGGNGGNGGTTSSTQAGFQGGNSTAFTLTAVGGGGGGRYDSNGGNGGSGGGAAARSSATGGTGGTGVSGQGFNGGSRTSTSGNNGGAGGGGAGGAGADNIANGTGRAGGAGVSSTITGTAVTYAGGGGGGGTTTTAGASDTGGVGGTSSANGAAALANTGGGGGGGGTGGSRSGGAGGSGIVVVRYAGPQVLAGGTVSTVGGDTVHQFLSTGNSTLDLYSATIAGDISGSGNLIWDKTGTLTLSGNNTYAGTTTIANGTLVVSGSGTINGSSGVTIASGSTLIYDSLVALTAPITMFANSNLGGTGTISGNLEFGSGSSLLVENLANPLDVVSGTVSFASSFGIANLSGIAWGSVVPGTYTLISGNVSSTNLINLGSGNAVDVGDGKSAYFAIGSLNLVVVPEPTTIALAACGLIGVGIAGRRLRRRRLENVC